nr:MAG TPA: hypothetical protein [Caudoviricetes sp.]DAH76305.1 MAG TPA: hypothetical protein [Caudoviricetes sp.]
MCGDELIIQDVGSSPTRSTIQLNTNFPVKVF